MNALTLMFNYYYCFNNNPVTVINELNQVLIGKSLLKNTFNFDYVDVIQKLKP